jgi:SAM-dependent methyltransferase
VSDDAAAAARFWIEHGHYTEDLPFWRREAARRGTPVLDLGAAAGRVAIALARDGVEVWALDGSAHMLAAMAERLRDEEPAVRERVHPVRADLRAFDLGRRFGLILMPMNTMQVLLDTEDQLGCLTACRRHLAPGGELLFDVAMPDMGEIAASLGLVRQGVRHHDRARGVVVQHSAWYEDLDPMRQELRFTLRTDDLFPDGQVRSHLRHHHVHLFLPTELTHLLARAGLEPLEVLGDFDGEPMSAASERQIWRCAATGDPA